MAQDEWYRCLCNSLSRCLAAGARDCPNQGGGGGGGGGYGSGAGAYGGGGGAGYGGGGSGGGGGGYGGGGAGGSSGNCFKVGGGQLAGLLQQVWLQLLRMSGHGVWTWLASLVRVCFETLACCSLPPAMQCGEAGHWGRDCECLQLTCTSGLTLC